MSLSSAPSRAPYRPPPDYSGYRYTGAEEPVLPDGSDDFRMTWVIDPDGNRIELVQWPTGRADGITAVDWVE